ncbi:MAG: hypothetical protein D3923_15760 [Candidatus Electrothrix sp. AR3]|nr:hypothetical protein [Candidatus Electrothrix sp. AR3]
MTKSILIISAIFSVSFLSFSVSSEETSKETCLVGYGSTIEEAFKAGAELAATTDAEMGGGNCIDAGARIRILPEKEDGLYVVEVYPSPNRGICSLPMESRTAEVIHP